MSTRLNRPHGLPEPLLQQLTSAREALLDVHKSLLDEERARYELTEGAINGSYHFLQLVIGDPWFAWLRPMSELIVAIDQLLASRQLVLPADAESLLDRSRALLTSARPGEAE